jgi:hypothetical protein
MGCASSTAVEGPKVTRKSLTMESDGVIREVGGAPTTTQGPNRMQDLMMASVMKMQEKSQAKQEEMMRTNPAYRDMMEQQMALQQNLMDAIARGDLAGKTEAQRKLMELQMNPENLKMTMQSLPQFRTHGKRGGWGAQTSGTNTASEDHWEEDRRFGHFRASSGFTAGGGFDGGGGGGGFTDTQSSDAGCGGGCSSSDYEPTSCGNSDDNW